MSDASQGPGWWQASDLKWYSPEKRPGWWQASDLKWYPPEKRPGWWQASDLKWYPPEQHQDDRPSPPPTQSASDSATPTDSVPSMVGGDPVSLARRLTTPQWVIVGALVLGVIGLLMAWVSAGIASESGINSDDGKFLGVLLVISAGLLTWRVLRLRRLNGSLLIIVWLGVLAFAVAEIIHVTTTHVSDSGFTIDFSVGSGLYVNAISSVVGLTAAIIDTKATWRSGKSLRAGVQQCQVGVAAGVSAATPATVANPSTPLDPKSELGDAVPLVPEAEALHAGGPSGSSPIYKKWRFWVGIAVVLQEIVLILALVNASSSKTTTPASSSPATTPASNAPATTPAAPVNLPFTQSGSGRGNTKAFTVTASSFSFQWSFNCPSGVNAFGFYVSIVQGTNKVASRWVSDDTDHNSDNSNPYFGPQGTYDLSIDTDCNWTITVNG